MILEMFWSSQLVSGLSISYDVTECLVKLHDYWASDIAFSLTLLSQFLEDMEAYAEVSKDRTLCLYVWQPDRLISVLCVWQLKMPIVNIQSTTAQTNQSKPE